MDVGGGEADGDFNENGDLDANDIDLLADEIKAATNNGTFDLTSDGLVDRDDLVSWIKDFKKTWVGDANLDGEFNSTDFVAVFTGGEYEDAVAMNSGWSDGDWNADKEFDTSDFVAAFTDGGYEKGRRGVAVVPEPNAFVVVIAALLFAPLVRKRNC